MWVTKFLDTENTEAQRRWFSPRDNVEGILTLGKGTT